MVKLWQGCKTTHQVFGGFCGWFCCGGLMGSKRLPPSMMADGNGYEQRKQRKR